MLINLYHTIRHHALLKSVLLLITGTAVTQVIQLLFSPLVTRLFNPEEFGQYALIISISTFLSVVATGQYESAILLPKKHTDAFNLLALVCLLTTLVCLAFSIMLSIFQWFDITLLNLTYSLWYFVPLMTFLICLNSALNFWHTRKEKYQSITFNRITQSAVTTGTQIGTGFLHMGCLGLVFSTFLGNITSVGMYGYSIFKKDNYLFRSISLKKIFTNAFVYRDFLKYTTFQALGDALRTNGIVFLIPFFFDAAVLGHYSLSIRILQTPILFIGTALAQVFFQKTVLIYNNKQSIWPSVKTLLIVLTVLSAPVFCGIFVAGEEIFSFIFGAKWATAGFYTQLLAPWIFANFIVSPVSSIPLILKKQREFMIIGTIYNILIPALFVGLAWYSLPVITILGWISCIGFVYHTIILGWIIRIIPK